VSQTYTLLVLSNDYLTVTLLPELGGRVYELIFKPTGHNELYRNPVLKPTRWGPPEQGWWLAAGGLEWPGDRVTVHSTGDRDLPPAGELMGWPTHNGRDYSRLGNWNRWLGFFEAPRAHGPFAGVYDTAADEGVLRVYPASIARGSKGFGFGWRDPLPSSLWTDDGSAYVEVHGGLAPTFWDFAALPPGHVVSWTELWYPLAGLGAVTVVRLLDAGVFLRSIQPTRSSSPCTPLG
jgi:hypothetical protein